MARVVEGLTFHNPLYSPFDLSRRRHDLFGQMLAGTLPEARDRAARTDRRAQNPSGAEDRGAYARHPLLAPAVRPPPMQRSSPPPPPPRKRAPPPADLPPARTTACSPPSRP